MSQNLGNDSVMKVSRIFEKVFTPEGDGFSGFTVYHGGNEFTNHIEYFVKDTRVEVSRKVAALHAGLCEACRQSADKDKND